MWILGIDPESLAKVKDKDKDWGTGSSEPFSVNDLAAYCHAIIHVNLLQDRVDA